MKSPFFLYRKGQSRSQSLRHPYPAERETDTLEESKPEPQNPGSGLIAPA